MKASKRKKVVRIEVRGGVAEVIRKPADVDVEIVDYDNLAELEETIDELKEQNG